MKRVAICGIAMTLLGCKVIFNVPVNTYVTPIERNDYVNKGVEWPVCDGRAVVVNESSVRIVVKRNDWPIHEVRVAPGIPYERIMVGGYDRYGNMIGWAERTFLCNKKDVERWIIRDYTLWWDHR